MFSNRKLFTEYKKSINLRIRLKRAPVVSVVISGDFRKRYS